MSKYYATTEDYRNPDFVLKAIEYMNNSSSSASTTILMFVGPWPTDPNWVPPPLAPINECISEGGVKILRDIERRERYHDIYKRVFSAQSDKELAELTVEYILCKYTPDRDYTIPDFDWLLSVLGYETLKEFMVKNKDRIELEWAYNVDGDDMVEIEEWWNKAGGYPF